MKRVDLRVIETERNENRSMVLVSEASTCKMDSGENLEEPIDLSSFPRPKNKPEQVPAIDDEVWRRRAETTTSLNQLRTAESVPLKDGIELIPFMGDLLKDKDASRHIVCRDEQRKVINYAFDESRRHPEKRNFVVAVRGSPGIGKSWSALLYLRKLMRQDVADRRPILFERGPEGHRVMCLFMPPKDSGAGGDENWIAYQLQVPVLPEEWMECRIIDVVIDPAQFAKGKAPVPSPLIYSCGHTFIPVSPDDRHLGGAHKTASLLIQLVLGPWSLKELKVAFPYMVFEDPRQVFNEEPQKYKEVLDVMEAHYYILGGLPRYLTSEKGTERMKEITPEKAKPHSNVLLDALLKGEDFNDDSTEKVLTRFFTLRAGEDQNGYNPWRYYATLDFVSPGAVIATGKIILEKIMKDVRWRGSNDASDIGLAFERVALAFLAQGTDGMKKLGITTRCKQLHIRTGQQDETTASAPVQLVLRSKSERIEAASNNAVFEAAVRSTGKGSNLSGNRLECNKGLAIPPDGYSNFDGMAGADLGFNVTLQKNHSVSGPEYVRQRTAFGLVPADKLALIFVVPPDRFDRNWFNFQNFSWKADDEAASTNRKRRRVQASGATAQTTAQTTARNLSAREKLAARESMLQFALTLEIEEDDCMEVEQEQEASNSALKTSDDSVV